MSAAASTVVCRLVPIGQLTRAEREAWSRLASRALEKNAFLCPEFVMPSLGLVSRKEPPLVLLAELGPERRVAGLGVFDRAQPTRKCPFPHLRAYKSPHSFLTGMLIQEDEAAAVARGILSFLFHGGHRWAGVSFQDMRVSGALMQQLHAACADLGGRWLEDHRFGRAALDLGPDTSGRWADHVRRSRMRDLHRCRRKLQKLGSLEWRFVDDEACEPQVEAMLRLEHLGWKSAAGTSLRSFEAHERFFREMVRDFGRAHRVFFTELLLDGEVIASTSNLCVGDQGFAFKVAFDPEYAKMGPGYLNEISFLEHVGEVGGITFLDSGSVAGGFVEELWPERLPIGSGVFVGRALPKLMAEGMRALTHAKRRTVDALRRSSSSGERIDR